LFLNFNIIIFYRFYVQTDADSICDVIINKFIISTFYDTYWSRPALKILLDLSVPVALCYGVVDNVIPNHQGEFFASLLDAQVPIFFIQGAWHIPFHIRKGLDFTYIVKYAGQYATIPGENAHKLSVLLNIFPWYQYRSTFNWVQTKNSIQMLYFNIIEKKTTICKVWELANLLHVYGNSSYQINIKK
jgi:hypothetical protein